jgi:hypothetical protein
MAGGIFVDQPYHPNPKCLLFSAIIMALYWFSPVKKNKFLLPVIFTISYVAMAWYDYRYNCDTIMYSGTSIGPNTFDAIFKPQRRDEKPDKSKKILPNQEQEYLKRVYLFHLIAIAPLLIYVGYKGNKVNPKFFPVVLSIGVMAGVYHGIRIFKPRQTANTQDQDS